MLDTDTRNMKQICSLLHTIRNSSMVTVSTAVPIEELIATAENIYHRMKESQ